MTPVFGFAGRRRGRWRFNPFRLIRQQLRWWRTLMTPVKGARIHGR